MTHRTSVSHAASVDGEIGTSTHAASSTTGTERISRLGKSSQAAPRPPTKSDRASSTSVTSVNIVETLPRKASLISSRPQSAAATTRRTAATAVSHTLPPPIETRVPATRGRGPASPNPSGASGLSREQYRESLINFFNNFNKEKVESVDAEP